MSRIRPGYEKYYINAECHGCGRETDTQYAYRFGEHEPTVYCDRCQRLRDKKRNHEKKHPRNIGLVRTYCYVCNTYIGKYESWDGRPVLDEMCVTCTFQEEEKRDMVQPIKELNMIPNSEIKDMIQPMIPSPETEFPEVLELVDPLKDIIKSQELKVIPDPGPEVRIEDYRNYFS